MERRSADNLFVLNDIAFKRREPIDLTKIGQLPTYRYLYERYLTGLKDKPKNLKGKKDIVINDIISEFRNAWIFMNIPPQTRPGVRTKFNKLLNKFDKLRFTHPPKKNDTWDNSVDNILKHLDNGLDIRATDKDVIKDIVDEFGVTPGDREETLYVDNCVPVPGSTKCAREWWCGGLDKKWCQEAEERRRKIEKADMAKQKRLQRSQSEQEQLKVMHEMQEHMGCDDRTFMSEEATDKEDEVSDEFIPGKCSNRASKTVKRSHTHSMETRGNLDAPTFSSSSTSATDFPKISTRTGYKTVNLDIMECLVVMESVFKVAGNKAPKLLCYIANKVFKQNWIVADDEKPQKRKRKRKEEEEEEEEEPPSKKQKTYLDSYENVVPSRPAVQTWVESFSFLSFADMAESIAKAEENKQVVTFGIDDTVKAAGTKRHDIKTGHVTIIGEDKSREAFCTGFRQNVSHAGKDAAEVVKLDISKMAVITGNTYEDMKGMINYFMTDRAGDGDTMLDNLEISPEKRLKCNAHVLLAIDHAMDKVFKDIETQVGASNLISEGAAHVFNAPKTSIWYLGLLALAKLLSPSHNAESISLHTEYKDFLRADSKSNSSTSKLSKDLIKNGLKGFESNRFGRLGELSATVVAQASMLNTFFENQVNEHANKLVLAVSCYKESEWFVSCSEVASQFYSQVTLKIKLVLGIDEYKDTYYPGGRSWKATKTQFSEILSNLEEKSKSPGVTGRERLVSKVSGSVHYAILNQLKMMNFFRNDDVEDIPQTPQTNLGCESEFGCVGNDLKDAGGAVSLKTVSDKHVISRNHLYKKPRWTDLNEIEKRKKWRWAAGSPEQKKIKELETEFLDRIKAVEILAVEKKRKKKQEIQKKLLENLEKCKEHGGPITSADIEKLDSLTYEQTVTEAGFLKKTTAPNIRYKRKVGSKMVNFSEKELKQQIRDAIQPNCNVTKNVDQLLLSVISNDSSTSVGVEELVEDVGKVALWKGPLGEQAVGVLIDASSLQLYKKTRHGFIPKDLPKDVNEWTCVDKIDSFHYVEKGGVILLILEEGM